MVDYNRIHFVGNGTPSPSCHPSDGSAVSSPQGEPIVSVADTKKYAIRRGDHRSPENRIHFIRNGTPSPSCHPSDGSAVSSPQGEPIVSVADTKKYAIRRGDHRSPENHIHFIRDGPTTSFLPPLRHFVPPLLKERLLRRPLEGSCRETTEG